MLWLEGRGAHRLAGDLDHVHAHECEHGRRRRPGQARRELSEAQLLDLLRERATDGNVAAISRLLEFERQRDPRPEAMAALERIAEERRS
jgi:hypothetical protein